MLEKAPEITDSTFDPNEAAYKRIQSQEWVSTAMDELCAAIGEMYVNIISKPPDDATTSYTSSIIGPILVHCDKISLSAQAEAAHAAVCASECQDWAKDLQSLEAAIVEQEATVTILRNTLEREKKLAEKRAQYEAIAKVILKEPAVEESERALKDAKTALQEVESTLISIEKVKEDMSKELRLFWHCTSGLDAFSEKIRALQVGEEQEEGEAMEIS